MPLPDLAPRTARPPVRSGRRAVLATAVGILLAATAVVADGAGASGETTVDPVPAVSGTVTVAPTPPPAAPATYYVDCRKGAAGDGTLAHPWRTLDAVNRHGAFTPAERILVRRATTCTGRLQPRGSGLPGAPIVLGAYGTGTRPVLAGRGTATGTGTVELRNVHDWTVQDLHLTNRGTSTLPTAYRSGLLFLNDHGGRLAGLVAQRLLVDQVESNPGGTGRTRAYGGISALTLGKRGDGFDGMRITGNTVQHLGRSGIAVFNGEYPVSTDWDVRVDHNTVRWARGDSIVLSGVDGARVDHNVSAYGANLGRCPVSRCGRMGGPSTASAAIWPTLASNIVIEHNEVYGEHAGSGDGEAFDVDLGAHNVVIQYNYAHNNDGGGVMFCGAKDTTVRFNILQNNKKAAFTFTCRTKVHDIRIYNNTVYQKASVAASAVVRTLRGFGGTTIRFLNNIVYTWGPGHYTFPSKPASASNTFVGTHHRTEPGGAGTTHRAPGLRNPGSGRVGMSTLGGYRLRTTSGAQRGHALPVSATLDFFGKPVNPAAPHRGASNTTR